MPPFGNLYDMDVYVEEALSWDDEIGFNAGTHSEIVKLAYKDFETLVHPRSLISDEADTPSRRRF